MLQRWDYHGDVDYLAGFNAGCVSYQRCPVCYSAETTGDVGCLFVFNVYMSWFRRYFQTHDVPKSCKVLCGLDWWPLLRVSVISDLFLTYVNVPC